MMRKIIEKKILPKYFDAVIRDKKKFEIRKDEDEKSADDLEGQMQIEDFPEVMP